MSKELQTLTGTVHYTEADWVEMTETQTDETGKTTEKTWSLWMDNPPFGADFDTVSSFMKMVRQKEEGETDTVLGFRGGMQDASGTTTLTFQIVQGT